MAALILGLVVRFFAVGVLRWVATKLLLFTLLNVVLPIVLVNLFHRILQGIMTLNTEAATGSGLSPVTITFTGLAGWLAATLRIPEGLSLVLGALAYRASVSMIPFLRK